MIFRRTVLLLAAPLLLAAADAPTIAQLYDGPITSVEKELVPLVEAMPADKFDFAPTSGAFKGVRSFADQAKHIAAVNYMVAAAAMGEKPPVDTGGESGPATAKTKDQVLKFLRDSFAYAHKAALSLTAARQIELVKSPFGNSQVTRGYLLSLVVSHTFDHYGQMVVYARMNNIIPPASR
jgi:uncharacterized damage-inducible protein DinB